MGISVAIGKFLLLILKIYFWIIIVSALVSWLVAFDVINIRNPQAANLVRLLEKLTEPVYRPLRKYIPSIGGIDITPIVIIFGIYLAEQIVYMVFFQ